MGKSSDDKEHGISLLRNTADETWSSDDTEVPSSVPLHTHPKHSRYLLLTNATLLFSNILVFFFFVVRSTCSEQTCTQLLSSFCKLSSHNRFLTFPLTKCMSAPALPHISYEIVTFQGFTAKSPYKGYPTDEIDSRWEDLDLGKISIFRER